MRTMLTKRVRLLAMRWLASATMSLGAWRISRVVMSVTVLMARRCASNGPPSIKIFNEINVLS